MTRSVDATECSALSWLCPVCGRYNLEFDDMTNVGRSVVCRCGVAVVIRSIRYANGAVVGQSDHMREGRAWVDERQGSDVGPDEASG